MDGPSPEPEAPEEIGSGPETRLGSARLYCEQCGEETPHRIFRVRRAAAEGRGTLSGVARCRRCRATHPFESRPQELTELQVIVSDGPRSTRQPLSLPPTERIRVGGPVPGPEEGLRVRRLDSRDGRPRTEADAREVATVWAARDSGAVVKVSVIDGAHTRPGRLVVPPETVFEVGGTATLDGERLEVTALRARGKTWRRPGDAFSAGEVQRLYGRRIARPPAGRRDWRSDRSMPSSRTSSSSRAERSRSSPGVRKTRTSPRARTAVSGASVQRVWSW